MHLNDLASSEALSAVLLVSIVTLSCGTAAAVILSGGDSEAVPAVYLRSGITPDLKYAYLVHEGGDVLDREALKIYVNGIDRTDELLLSNTMDIDTSDGYWDTLEPGTVLMCDLNNIPVEFDEFGDAKSDVVVVYNNGYKDVLMYATGNIKDARSPGMDYVFSNFTADVYEGFADLTVNFTDKTIGIPMSWLWNFGSLGMSNDVNPVFTFKKAGKHAVTLKVENYDGTVNTSMGWITVNPSPNFSAEPVSGKEPLLVQFTDTSLGMPEIYHWDFGDVSSSNDKSPAHTFEKAGDYTVVLNVKSDGTNSYSTAMNIHVSIAAKFDYFVSADNPLLVKFTDTSSSTSSEWDFGDGKTGTGREIGHTYSQAGIYTVKLKVTDVSGVTDVCEKTIMISPGAGFTYSPELIRAGDSAVFTPFSTGSGYAWKWDFGDGTGSTDEKPSHTFDNAGTYVVSLTVTMDNMTTTAKREIEVLNKNEVMNGIRILSCSMPGILQDLNAKADLKIRVSFPGEEKCTHLYYVITLEDVGNYAKLEGYGGDPYWGDDFRKTRANNQNKWVDVFNSNEGNSKSTFDFDMSLNAPCNLPLKNAAKGEQSVYKYRIEFGAKIYWPYSKEDHITKYLYLICTKGNNLYDCKWSYRIEDA